ncbi:hypothetical protein VNO78_06040 [Psophocarpus tetragonolobus]|uniref:Wound-responsive family protein n=1 Tax=Psophocarpus tetragonolobus TaxID=3891 RepID=A0AAN9STQ2_PSOTE
MSSAQRGWIVAASVGVVEALKDQGVCRWNHTLKTAQQVIKSHVGSFSLANSLSSSAMASSTSSRRKKKQSEESLRTFCWILMRKVGKVNLPAKLLLVNEIVDHPEAPVKISPSCGTVESTFVLKQTQLLPAKIVQEEFQDHKMSSAIRGWSVAASVGVVEALKDQGICRWNHVLRSVQQHVKSHTGSFSQMKKVSSSAMVSTALKHEKAKQSEESLRTIMYLSCWGPN